MPGVAAGGLPRGRHRGARAVAAVLLAILAACDRAPADRQPAVVTVQPEVRHQTISGWAATAHAGQGSELFSAYRDQMLDLAVDYLGLNRLRLEVRSGAENSRDLWTAYRSGELPYDRWRAARYSTVNDNDDPRRIDPAGFHFSELDHTVAQVVLPIRQRLEARGETLHVNLNYVAFTRQIRGGLGYHHDRPEEYAEFVLATLLHLRRTHGWLPDSWEVILEPDNVPHWSGRLVGEAIVAAARRLEEHDIRIPFVAPSNTSMSAAVSWFDELAAVPGALQRLGMISYHRYRGVSGDALLALAERARRHGLQTGMLEHIPSGFATLFQDLTAGRNSAWQQFTLGGPEASERGGAYFLVDATDPDKPRAYPAQRTRYLRHCFRFVRRGAVRIGAESNRPGLDPLAFAHPDGRIVAVIQVRQAGRFSVIGLPAGRYAVRYTVGRSDRSPPTHEDVTLPEVRLQQGDRLTVKIPGSGAGATYAVVTIHPPPAPRDAAEPS